ncbi:MAG: glycosyltransferase [Candidatus Bathyarchaeia archaeon]
MKICAVTTWLPYRDGVSLYSAQLYEHISKKAEVIVLANIIDSLTSNEKILSVPGYYRVIRCWKRGDFLYPFKIFSKVLMEKPSLIHLQYGWLLYGDKLSPLLFPLLLLLLRLTKRPVIVTMHTIIGNRPRLYENRMINFMAKAIIIFLTKAIVNISNKIIVHNSLMKKTLENLYSLHKYSWKIVVIPHGVREAPKKLRKPRRRKTTIILSLGFVRKGKGIEYLIEAFRRFSDNHPKATFIIVGGKHAHDSDEYIKLIKNMLLSNGTKNIIFVGFVDEEKLDRLILESDIIVLSSLERWYVEASGSLARVAMYGKPIVCSRVPKFEIDLKDREDCVMVNPDDPKELTEALLLLASNKSLCRKIGRNLMKKFKDRTWSKVSKQHIELFRSSLKGYWAGESQRMLS